MRAASERLKSGKGFVYGDAVEVADYIRRLNLKDSSLFAMSDHVIYWMLEKPLLTKLAHPSNIFRPALLAVVYKSEAPRESELEHILQKRPTIVVVNTSSINTRGLVKEKERLKSFLISHVLVFCSGNLSVYIEEGRAVTPSKTCPTPVYRARRGPPGSLLEHTA